MTKNLLLYGTLRDPGKPTITITGYKMYDLGSYPGVVYTGDDNDTVVCQPVCGIGEKNLEKLDLYEAYYPDDPESSLYIRRICQVEGTEFEIYEYNRGPINNEKPIPQGDWLQAKPNGVDNSHMIKKEELA